MRPEVDAAMWRLAHALNNVTPATEAADYYRDRDGDWCISCGQWTHLKAPKKCLAKSAHPKEDET